WFGHQSGFDRARRAFGVGEEMTGFSLSLPYSDTSTVLLARTALTESTVRRTRRLPAGTSTVGPPPASRTRRRRRVLPPPPRHPMLDPAPAFRPIRFRDGYPPAADFSLIGDGATAALVGLDAARRMAAWSYEQGDLGHVEREREGAVAAG